MSNLINFKKNLKDSMTNSLLDYINYMHETKNSEENSDTLAKCVVLCGELFANQIRKGDSQADLESFEAYLMSQKIFPRADGLDLANNMVREGNAMALFEYESKYGEANKTIGSKRIA